MGISHESIPYRFPNELYTLHDKIGVLEAIGWDVPNFTKNVPNFVKGVLDFVKDVPRVPKCILRWGSTPNHFFMSSQVKLWTLGDKMRVLEVIEWDVPNFVKDIPRVPKCVQRWGSTPNHFLMGSQMKL